MTDPTIQFAGPRRGPVVTWCVAGGLVLAGAVGMAWVSPQAAADLAARDRDLWPLVTWYGVACAGFVLAALLLWLKPRHSRATPLGILFVAVGARLAMCPTPLIQSDDAYRYVLDGHAVLAGVNPFRFSPAELKDAAPPAWLSASPAALDILERVNHPDVPTIYPPLAQATFAIAAWMRPWSVLGPRAVFLACDLLTIAALLWWLRRLRRPAQWVLIYAWNPLVIKEIANSAHLDSLVALSIVALTGALLSVERRTRLNREPSLGLAAAVGVLLGVAVLTKLYPLILLAIALCVCTRPRLRWLAGAVLLISASATVAAGYAPFLGVGTQRVFEGLQTYSDHWINNPGIFSVLESWSDEPRRAAGQLLAVLAAGLALRLRATREPGPDAVLAAVQLTLLLWLLLMPTCLPWYAVPLLAVAVLRPRAWAVGLTVGFGLFYGALACRYGDRESLASTLQIIEHGLFWATILPDMVRFAIKPGRR